MKHVRLASLVLALVAPACVASPPEDEGEATRSASSAVTSLAACPATRFIATSTIVPCASITTTNGKYVASPLFSSAAPALGGYCAFDWVPDVAGASPTPGDYAGIGKYADRDCNVVAALGTLSKDDEVAGPMHRTALRQAGASRLPVLASGAPPAPIRVAMIDTSPSDTRKDGSAVTGRSDHGYVLGRVIRELTCAGEGTSGPCIGQLAHHLAMPFVAPGEVDATHGGFFGRQTDLARAIVAAVDAWESRKRSGTEPERLVLNLSVGWDAGRGYETSGLHAGLSHPAAAVRAALRHAACHGAIAIAASGNRSGGKVETTGAMFPAAWETLSAPTEAECKADEGRKWTEDAAHPVFDHFVFAAVPPRPLVYAVSGVDATDRPLALTRTGGLSRLVAQGQDVLATDATTKWTSKLTGSSAATAIVSAAVAATWAYAPSMTPGAVMRLVTSSATDLSVAPPPGVKATADFCIAQPCGGIRRVGVGQSVAEVCKQVGCGSFVPTKVAAYAGVKPSWSKDWSSIEPALDGKPAAPCSACSSPSSTLVTKDAEPWVGPQPGKGGCDTCGLYGDLFQLYMTDPWWYGGYGTTAYLGVQTTTTSYQYTLTPTAQAQTFTLTGLADPVQSAVIAFAPKDQYATLEQVTTW